MCNDLFMMEWKVKDGKMEEAVKKFLSTNAPLPKGATLEGRYHAPGSQPGWLVVRTEDLKLVYEHATEWGELLNWTITPILCDEHAGAAAAKVWGVVKLGCI